MNKLVLIVVVAIMAGVFLYFTPPKENQASNQQNAQSSAAQQQPAESPIAKMYASISGDEFDKAYLSDMIAHHQGALNMASLARSESTKSEIRKLSETILATQTKEVQKMMDWQQQWGYIDGTDPHAGHVMEGGAGMGADMAAMEAKLYDLTGKAYDKEFLTQMILHHQQAVDMSKYAATNAKHQELKDLAATIITTQQKEIDDMKRWQIYWGY